MAFLSENIRIAQKVINKKFQDSWSMQSKDSASNNNTEQSPLVGSLRALTPEEIKKRR
jgi:hypothetical protein